MFICFKNVPKLNEFVWRVVGDYVQYNFCLLFFSRVNVHVTFPNVNLKSKCRLCCQRIFNHIRSRTFYKKILLILTGCVFVLTDHALKVLHNFSLKLLIDQGLVRKKTFNFFFYVFKRKKINSYLCIQLQYIQ